MEFSIKSGSPEKQRSACVVVGVFESRKLTLPAELLDKARAFAATYVNKSPIAAQMIKRSVNQVMGALDRALMHMDADQNLLTHTSADQKAAAAAYAAKTEPRFSGD